MAEFSQYDKELQNFVSGGKEKLKNTISKKGGSFTGGGTPPTFQKLNDEIDGIKSMDLSNGLIGLFQKYGSFQNLTINNNQLYNATVAYDKAVLIYFPLINRYIILDKNQTTDQLSPGQYDALQWQYERNSHVQLRRHVNQNAIEIIAYFYGNITGSPSTINCTIYTL